MKAHDFVLGEGECYRVFNSKILTALTRTPPCSIVPIPRSVYRAKLYSVTGDSTVLQTCVFCVLYRTRNSLDSIVFTLGFLTLCVRLISLIILQFVQKLTLSEVNTAERSSVSLSKRHFQELRMLVLL